MPPARFIDHVLGLIAFETDEGRVVSKKIAAYHQARAVVAARERVAVAAGVGGDRRGGVVLAHARCGKITNDPAAGAARSSSISGFGTRRSWS